MIPQGPIHEKGGNTEQCGTLKKKKKKKKNNPPPKKTKNEQTNKKNTTEGNPTSRDTVS
jgi:hypothetical protein